MITAANPSFILTNLCSAFTLFTFKLTLYIVHELDGARLQVSHRIRSVFAINLGSLAQWRLQTFAPGEMMKVKLYLKIRNGLSNESGFLIGLWQWRVWNMGAN